MRFIIIEGRGIKLSPFFPWKVYNVLGQQVATLIHGFQQAGYPSAVWEGHDTAGTPVSCRTYFYRLVAGDFVQARTMLLLR